MEHETRLIMEDDNISRVSVEKRHSFSPLRIIIDGILPRDTFSYGKLASEPLKLSVLKLDGSCFDIEVTKAANVAELKQAVQAVFRHMPQKGSGKISWPHVWRQFCLSFGGQKLLTDTDSLQQYGIKDGDQLRFIRHISNTCNLKMRSKKRVVVPKIQWMLLFRLRSYRQEVHNDDDAFGFEDLEKGKLQNYKNNEVQTLYQKLRVTRFIGGWFSYAKKSPVIRTRTEDKRRISHIASSLLLSIGKIGNVVCLCKRKSYSLRDTWRERLDT